VAGFSSAHSHAGPIATRWPKKRAPRVCRDGKVKTRALKKSKSKGCGTLRDLRATISVAGDVVEISVPPACYCRCSLSGHLRSPARQPPVDQ
jgi:hypothetical protein